MDTQRRNYTDELHEALRESLHLSFVTGDQGFSSEQQLATFVVVSLVFSPTPTHLKAVLTSGRNQFTCDPDMTEFGGGICFCSSELTISITRWAQDPQGQG